MSTFEDQLAGALREYAATLRPAAAGRPAPRTPRHATPPAGRGQPRARRRWPLLAAAPLVAAAAIALWLVLPSDRTTPPASAAALLRSAATVAGREAPLGPGEELYIRQRYAGRTGTGVDERWLRADGSGRFVRREGGRVVERGRVATIASARDADREAREVIAQNPGFDPAQLHAYVAYRVLHEVLESPAPGPVRAAAYRRLAAVPGLRILQRSGDRVLLAARVGDVEFRARIDTGDGRVLALERVLLRESKQIPGLPRVVDRTVFEAQRVVRR